MSELTEQIFTIFNMAIIPICIWHIWKNASEKEVWQRGYYITIYALFICSALISEFYSAYLGFVVAVSAIIILMMAIRESRKWREGRIKERRQEIELMVARSKERANETIKDG